MQFCLAISPPLMLLVDLNNGLIDFILVSEGVIPKAFGYRETFFNVAFEFKEVVMRADD